MGGETTGGGETATGGAQTHEGGGGGMAPGEGGRDPSGTGAGDSCADQGPGEVNDAFETATQLAGSDDCDTVMKFVDGTIDGPTDVDWYVYEQTGDTALCTVNPNKDWSQDQGATIRVCKYPECQNDPGMTVDGTSCKGGAVEDFLPNGVKGCCHDQPFDIDFGLFGGCDGSDDSLNVWMKIDVADPDADICHDYHVVYNF